MQDTLISSYHTKVDVMHYDIELSPEAGGHETWDLGYGSLCQLVEQGCQLYTTE